MNWQYEDGRIYSKNENNELLAETTFVFIGDNKVNIDHTYVNPILRGQGVAGKMLEVVAEYLSEKGLKATASCSYANAWLKKHRESYSDIISDDFDTQGIACKIERH